MATIAERFWEKVDRSGGPDACWPWLAYCSPKGYGQFSNSNHGKHIGAHVFSFELANGFRPPMVCHSCDNPPCCNPAHLFAGDTQINMEDMSKKGRSRVPHNHPAKKLTNAVVKEIRFRYISRSRKHGTRALAREFDISHQLVSMVASGERWQFGLDGGG